MECQYHAPPQWQTYAVNTLYVEKAQATAVYVIYVGMPVNFVEINVTDVRIPHHIPKTMTLKYLCLWCTTVSHLHSNCTFIMSGLCL
jgi:hypothetical protein